MERTAQFSTRTPSQADTVSLGHAIGERIEGGLCIVLVGPLGAGKTTMVRGLCRGLGVDDAVLSPTFILYEEFEGKRRVVHVDLYRLEHEREIEELGVFDLIGGDSVILVEWGDRSETLMAHADAVIHITHETGSERTVTITCTGEAERVLRKATQWS